MLISTFAGCQQEGSTFDQYNRSDRLGSNKFAFLPSQFVFTKALGIRSYPAPAEGSSDQNICIRMAFAIPNEDEFRITLT